MADESIDIRVRLREQRKFSADTKRAATDVRGVGKAADQVDKSARRSQRSVGRLRGSFNTLGGGARVAIGGVGTALGLYGVSRALGTIYTEGREAIKTTKATAAVLKSTGGAANITAGQVGDLSTSLSNKAAIDDETIQQGLNLLLTFRDIRNEAGKGNDIFNQTASAAVDMASAFKAAGKNMSVSDAMLQIGKAVNDPVKGMTRLQRIGVTFTKQQTDQVKALTDSGDKLGAQRVIIRELNKEFGGMAGAQADPMQRLGVILNNLAETIGVALIPYLDKAAKWLGTFIMQMQDGSGAGGRFADTVATIWRGYVDWVTFAFGKIGNAITWLKGAWANASQWVTNAAHNIQVAVVSAFNWVRHALGLTGGDAGKFARAVYNAGRLAIGVWLLMMNTARRVFMGVIWPIVRRAMGGVVQVVRGALQVLGGVIKIFTGVFTGDWRMVWAGVKQVFRGGVNAVVGILRAATAPFRAAASAVGNAIKGAFEGAFNWIADKIQWVIDKVNWAKGQLDSITPGSNSIDPGAAGDPASRDFLQGFGFDVAPKPKVAPKLAIPSPLGSGAIPRPVPVAVGAGGGDIVLHNTLELDGQVAARSTGRHVRRRQNRS